MKAIIFTLALSGFMMTSCGKVLKVASRAFKSGKNFTKTERVLESNRLNSARALGLKRKYDKYSEENDQSAR